MKNIIEEIKQLNKKFNLAITINEKCKGKPLVVKDNICTKGIETTAGSQILRGYFPPFDATVVMKLKAKGYDVLAKTAMDEFGFGTFSVNTFKIPKNPHDAERVCGGSSGGSAALVAASKIIRLGLGTSTGGSISCPVAFCGVVGLTPTYGLVSRYGLIDYANSLDKIGVIGKTVKDAAELLTMIAGHDEKDSTSLNKKPENYKKYCGKTIKGMRIGVPKEYFEGISGGVKKQVEAAIKKLENLGARVEKISLPLTKYSLASYYIIAMAEASTNLAKFCGLRYGAVAELKGNFNEYFSETREKYFGAEAKRRILLGTFVRMAGYRDKYYLNALRVRALIIKEFKNAFKKFDAIVAPTMPIIAPKFSEIEKLSPAEIYAMDVLTIPPNIAGLPHISVPCGLSKGMPVGLHIIGDNLQEGKIIRVADCYGRA